MTALALLIILIISYALTSTRQATMLEQARQNLTVLSSVIAENSHASVLFDDPATAKQILSALKAKPDIVHADLFHVDGTLLASYQSNEEADSHLSIASLLQSKNHLIHFDDNKLYSYTPLLSEGEVIGLLHIIDDMSTSRKQLDSFYQLVTTTALIAFSIAILIALWMQSLFTSPLTKLIKVIDHITHNKDYSQRVDLGSNDEFSQLANDFNNMIEEIELRGNELEEINDELEQRVANRTEALQQSLELANEASRAKSDFLAVMSHEIRTPLNGVVGFSELLTLENLDDNIMEMVTLLDDSAQSLLHLLNEILDFSKLDASRVELDLTEFNLEQLIHSSIAGQQAVANNKQIEIHFSTQHNANWQFIGDSIRIRQIINNLISNALKFTDHGSITIDTKFEDIDSDTMVTVRVTDTGVGIEDGALKTIFSPFTQADNTITRKYGGTGLGLAICQQLIVLMKGQYGAESKLGEGSSFWFTLPLHSSISSQVDVLSQQNNSPVTTKARSSHILIAEDNLINQLVAKGLIEALGHNCEIVENGKEALACATTKPFDLILMDYHMPEMDGLTATQKIRDLGLNSVNFNTPIIALTADIQPHVSKQFRHAGANDCLLKPFSHDDLNNCLNLWLHQQTEKKAISSSITNNNNSDEPILINAPLDEMQQLSAESGAELVSQIINLYLQHSPELISQIEQAVSSNNNEGAFKAAHSLKSSSGNIGAKRMQSIAQRIEQLGRDENISEAGNVSTLLQSVFDTTKHALKQKLGELN